MKKFLFIVVMVLGTINCNAFSFFGIFNTTLKENKNTQKRHVDTFYNENENTYIYNVDIIVTPTDSGKVQLRVLKDGKEVFKHTFRKSTINQIGNSNKFKVHKHGTCKPVMWYSEQYEGTLLIFNKNGLR